MSTKTTTRQSARERLLAAASELFYEEGVHTVGIDRVIERAGVAKATLYSAFGSKEKLVRAYLQARHAATRERMARELAARHQPPRERCAASRSGAPPGAATGGGPRSARCRRATWSAVGAMVM